MNREELFQYSKEQLIDLALQLLDKIAALELEINELGAKLGTNSSNSSKPPSMDGLGKPAPKSRREKSGKKPGGQPGHQGHGLKIDREPDETIEHTPETCSECGAKLPEENAKCVETRYVWEIDVIVKLIEHKQMSINCPFCGAENRGDFPAEVCGTQNYGAGIRAFSATMVNYAMVGIDKTHKILNDVLQVPISTGTLANINAEYGEKMQPLLVEIKEKVQSSPIVHFDETGFRVNGKTHWLHNSSTSEATYIIASEKRGTEGIEANGVLPDFSGVAIHDCWKPYFNYDTQHALCNAHLLRELQYVCDRTEQQWAGEMQKLLLELKENKEQCIEDGKTEMPADDKCKFSAEYARIVTLGESENPLVEGERKRGKIRSLLDRFINYEPEITLFANDFTVPFDNNQAERDIRNAKVKQKVSGGLRSTEGADDFAAFSSVIGTAQKQNRSIFTTLKDIARNIYTSLFPPRATE
jgi:transposase